MPSGIYKRKSINRSLYDQYKNKTSVPFNLFSLRIRRGFKIKEALSKQIQKKNTNFNLSIKGKKFRHMKEISRLFKINYGTLIGRYNSGARGEALIKEPRIRAFKTEKDRKRAELLRWKKYRIQNRDERNKYSKNWKKNNPEYFKKYLKNNKHRIQKLLQDYRKKNKDKRNEYNRNWRKNNKDSPTVIWQVVRSRFNNWLRNKNFKRRDEMLLIIGCDKKDFKTHIQKQFKKGMSWNNHGKWHIDHIKPLAVFNPKKDSDILEAFNYKNMQPLWKLENLRKNKKILKTT